LTKQKNQLFWPPVAHLSIRRKLVKKVPTRADCHQVNYFDHSVCVSKTNSPVP
jgi:hypothetical protein